jgi:hypothetical protein
MKTKITNFYDANGLQTTRDQAAFEATLVIGGEPGDENQGRIELRPIGKPAMSPHLTPPREGQSWSTPKPLTIQDRAAMVDPLERAEIERQCLDAFVDDLAAALEKREAQSTHVREASGVSAALALVKVRLRIWTGTRK